MTDTFGNPRDDLDSDPFFQTFITFNTAAGQQVTRRSPAPQTAYPSTGAWLITCSDKHYIDAGGIYYAGDEYYTNGINALAGGPGLKGIPNITFPIKFGTNSYTQQERNDSWANLKARIFDARFRNFYYHGHGGPNIIGSDVHTFDTNNLVTGGTTLPGSKAYLTSQSVSNELTFNRYSGAHPYRFVWLDGCSTANGNWPGAFGMGKGTNSASSYTNSVTNPQHRRPSAFVGWNQTIGGSSWGATSAKWLFRSQWMTDWSYNDPVRTLTAAFGNARHDATWPPGGDNQLWGALRVYGYADLKFEDYNHKNDWQWP